MAALVAKDRRLWFNLLGIKDKVRSFLLDALVSLCGLLDNAVSIVVDRFQAAEKQSEAFRQFFPCPNS